jgi:hypothetical protein
MGNLLFNIRFGRRHLQVTDNYKVSFKINDYWLIEPYDTWFEVYCLFGKYR